MEKRKMSTSCWIIWYRHGVRKGIGNSVLKTAVASAVICYNDGVQGTLPVLTKLGTEHGFFTPNACRKADICRVKLANRKSTNKVKQRRKTLRAVRKGFNDKNEQEEGETYGSEDFWISFAVVFNIPFIKGGGRFDFFKIDGNGGVWPFLLEKGGLV